MEENMNENNELADDKETSIVGDMQYVRVTLGKVLQVALAYVLMLLYFEDHQYLLKRTKLVDMSHSFTNDTIYWPDQESFEIDTVYKGNTGKFWFEANAFSGAEHGGTHMDAPVHFSKDGWKLGDIPIDRFITTAVVVDITSKCESDADAELTVEDLIQWETIHGKIPDGSCVFMYSGWYSKWPSKEGYLGNAVGNLSDLHFPGIHPEAAIWLVDKRNVNGVGVDTASLDHGPSTEFLSHRTILGNNLFGLENVNNIGELPALGARVYTFPMKIKEGSGGPCRIMAEVNLHSKLLSKACLWAILGVLVVAVVIV